MADGVLPDRLCALGTQQGTPKVLGVSVCMNQEEYWEYYIAIESNQEPPQGMYAYVVPAGMWAVFPGAGKQPQAIQELERRAMTEWLPSSGYLYGDAPDIEVYLNNNPEDSKFELWVPIIVK